MTVPTCFELSSNTCKFTFNKPNCLLLIQSFKVHLESEPSSKFSGSAHICDKQNQAIVGSVEASEAYEALVFKINTLVEQICVFFNRKLEQIGIQQSG